MTGNPSSRQPPLTDVKRLRLGSALALATQPRYRDKVARRGTSRADERRGMRNKRTLSTARLH
jgi:hypothetical protein